MPIRLGTKEGRVAVQPSFIEEMEKIREVQRARIMSEVRKHKRELQRSDIGTWNKRLIMKKIADLRNRYMKLLDTQADIHSGRCGLDYEISRLRKLPYKRLLVKLHKDSMGTLHTFLIGETHKLTTTIGQENFKNSRSQYRYQDFIGKKYEHGPYFICVDKRCLGDSELIWHIIPSPDPKSRCRHMHTSVNGHTGASNPLDFVQRTCWGSFNGIIQNLCMDGDIPEIFLLLHRFAEVLVLDDALTDMETLISYGLCREVR